MLERANEGEEEGDGVEKRVLNSRRFGRERGLVEGKNYRNGNSKI